jgi:hypothetical protein
MMSMEQRRPLFRRSPMPVRGLGRPSITVVRVPVRPKALVGSSCRSAFSSAKCRRADCDGAQGRTECIEERPQLAEGRD